MKLFRLVRQPQQGRKQRLVPMSKQDERLQEEVNRRNERRRAEREARKLAGQPS